MTIPMQQFGVRRRSVDRPFSYRVGIVAKPRFDCRLPYMRENPLFPVDLSDYRSELEAAGKKLESARRAEESARARVRELVLAATAAGISEVEAARLTGVARVTVREWAGK